MKKVNWSCEKDKTPVITIEYIFCLLIIGIIIISTNIIIYFNSTTNMVLIETSKINTTNMLDEETVSNFKIEVLDYDKLSYYIKVNCKTQVVTVYTCDENGKYNIPIKNMLCSTGIATPEKGVFEISDKYEWRYLVGNVYGQYATRITGQILFHSVPYTKQDKSSLEYWEYDKLGQPVSKGCVRLTVEDAKWIYDYCKPGTQVEFCEDDSEKIEKPVKMKISDYSDELRKWDPTDPDESNPWLEYKKHNEGEN